jgi:hypothetical protein
MPLLPVPVLGSTNWSPWAAALQDVVAGHETAIASKAATSHTHEGTGGGTGTGGAGFLDGGSATSTFSDTTIDGGSATA